MRSITPLVVLLLAGVPLACGGDETPPRDTGDRSESAATGGEGATEETAEEPEGSFELALSGGVDLEVSGSDIRVRRDLPGPDWLEELRIDLRFPHDGQDCALVLRLPVGDTPVGEEKGTYTPRPQGEREPGDYTSADLAFCRLPLAGDGTTRAISSSGGTVEITRATDAVVEGTLDVEGAALVERTAEFRDVRITGTFTVPRDG